VTSGSSLIGYIRVSTEDQGESGGGLAAQREAIAAECHRRNWRLDRIEQDILSGRDLRRPGLQSALDACRDGQADGIIVAKLDRLSRSVIDFARLVDEARRGGWNIVALDFGLDLSTPQGELVANVLMAVAQWERRMIGARTKEALAAKRASGVRLGRPSQLGDEARRTILRLRNDERLTLPEIAGALSAAGIPSASGRPWSEAMVRSVLRRLPGEMVQPLPR
jgi:DNA invertase Pin-like site-specific DNA recombinase